MDFQTLAWFCGTMFFLSIVSLILHKYLTQEAKYRQFGSPDKSLVLFYVEIMGYVFMWYGISVGFTIFNKWFLNDWEGGFKFPVGATMVHMFVKYILSRMAIHYQKQDIEPLVGNEYLCQAVPIGISTALDVMMSNMSFMFITVTFYTIVKSGVLFWILMFSLCLGIEEPRLVLGLIVLLIVLGISLASYGESDFNATGFMLVVGASAFGGLRWALTQKLMRSYQDRGGGRVAFVGRGVDALRRGSWAEGESGSGGGGSAGGGVGRKRGGSGGRHGDLEEEVNVAAGGVGEGVAAGVTEVSGRLKGAPMNTLAMIYHISPASALTLVPAFLILEGGEFFSSDFVSEPGVLLEALLLVCLGGVIAFLLIGVEIMLVGRTSGLTLGVLGHLKELVQIVISMLVFADKLTVLNAVGLGMALSGIVWYKILKRSEMLSEGGVNGGSGFGRALYRYGLVLGSDEAGTGELELELELDEFLDLGEFGNSFASGDGQTSPRSRSRPNSDDYSAPPISSGEEEEAGSAAAGAAALHLSSQQSTTSSSSASSGTPTPFGGDRERSGTGGTGGVIEELEVGGKQGGGYEQGSTGVSSSLPGTVADNSSNTLF